MNCRTKSCGALATCGFRWIGREPQASCLDCLNRAHNIASVMGFKVEEIALKEIEQEVAKDSIDRLRGRAL